MEALSQSDFFDRYDIDIVEGRLGGGAFGTVYKAYDNLRDEWKAIKIAEVKVISDKEFSLVDEFEATRGVPVHKNIINYESVHTFEMPNGIFDYAVMQYYPSGNLKQLVRQGTVSDLQKEQIIKGILKGVAFLHEHGVIHRDLKPSNILISERRGRYIPKIADFGLSKSVLGVEDSAITNSFGGGTLEYSSPEQLLGHRLRSNTDLWSVGVIAYELLTGEIPFLSGDLTGSTDARRQIILERIVNAPVPDHPNLQEPWDRIVKDCLVKDAKDRVQSATNLLRELKKPVGKSTIVIKSFRAKASNDSGAVDDEATQLLPSHAAIMPEATPQEAKSAVEHQRTPKSTKVATPVVKVSKPAPWRRMSNYTRSLQDRVSGRAVHMVDYLWGTVTRRLMLAGVLLLVLALYVAIAKT